MELTGEQRIAAPRQTIWAALNDPAVLRAAIPGCVSLDRDGDDRFNLVAEVRIGPIGARFKGAVQLSDIDAPNGYVISGKGSGGVAGSAQGKATVRLTDDGSGTLLRYVVDADVGGRMAQLGGPVIDATARKLADRFFAAFAQTVTGSAPVAAVPATMARQSRAAEAGLPWPWLAALLVAVGAGYVLGRSGITEPWVAAMMVLTLVAACAGYLAGKRA
jgi:uncharacterized protein